MECRTLQHLLHLNTRIVNGEPLNDTFRAELETMVAALRQQRATALATSEAKAIKYNRPVRDAKPDSFAPVDLHIADYKIPISDNYTGDDLADRLVAVWNCCLGVPTQDLLPGHYSSLRAREPS